MKSERTRYERPLPTFVLQIGANKREPTSGLEPLTCSLRVSCSGAEKATHAASRCC